MVDSPTKTQAKTALICRRNIIGYFIIPSARISELFEKIKTGIPDYA